MSAWRSPSPLSRIASSMTIRRFARISFSRAPVCPSRQLSIRRDSDVSSITGSQLAVVTRSARETSPMAPEEDTGMTELLPPSPGRASPVAERLQERHAPAEAGSELAVDRGNRVGPRRVATPGAVARPNHDPFDLSSAPTGGRGEAPMRTTSSPAADRTRPDQDRDAGRPPAPAPPPAPPPPPAPTACPRTPRRARSPRSPPLRLRPPCVRSAS